MIDSFYLSNERWSKIEKVQCLEQKIPSYSIKSFSEIKHKQDSTFVGCVIMFYNITDKPDIGTHVPSQMTLI